jgi:uroporphyrinogen-III synthase
LSDPTRIAIAEHQIDAALFFSPRNAATFVRLATGLEEGCKHVVAVALSSAIAEKLAPLPWRRIAVASAPNESALLAALESSMAS